VAVVFLSACGGRGHDAALLKARALSHLTLQPRDVPAPLQEIDARKQGPAELRGPSTRHGRSGGWIARFKRAGGPTTTGPLVIESRADTFRDDAGAAADFADESRGLLKSAGNAGHAMEAPRVGEQTSALTVLEPGLRPVRFYSIVWRQHNAVASITVEGWDGKISQRTAWTLARRQARRNAAAASS
jgi:hypothetical protein